MDERINRLTDRQQAELEYLKTGHHWWLLPWLFIALKFVFMAISEVGRSWANFYAEIGRMSFIITTLWGTVIGTWADSISKDIYRRIVHCEYINDISPLLAKREKLYKLLAAVPIALMVLIFFCLLNWENQFLHRLFTNYLEMDSYILPFMYIFWGIRAAKKTDVIAQLAKDYNNPQHM